MKVPPILAFLQELVDDRELQAEFAREVMGKEPTQAAAAVSGLGARRGYSFTAEDALMARRVLQDLAARTSGGGQTEGDELGEQELGIVVGGAAALTPAVALHMARLATDASRYLTSW